jgi:plasmid stabilization system protein ParE
MIVVFTEEAEDDLEEIGDWIAKDNPPRAVSFVQELVSTCADLAEAPMAYPIVLRLKRFGVRRRVYGDYLIFYRVVGETVEISHILHGARDYDAIL